MSRSSILYIYELCFVFRTSGWRIDLTMFIQYGNSYYITSGDIPKNNSRKCQFFTKMTKNKKLPNFLSNFQNWFRNDLQHLTEVFRPYHPCKKSLEIDFQIPKKKVFLIFPFFSRFLGVYFYKASWLVNTCWLNVDQTFFSC